MRPVYRGFVPVHETGRGSQAVSPEEYGFFRAQLIKRLGEYCSYCEVPLGANLAIEHMVSKSENANLETEWDNLLLACTNCNSTKGNKISDIEELADYFWASDTTVNTFQKFRYRKFTDVDGYTKVWVEPADPPGVAYDRADDLIDLVGLNKYIPLNDNSKASDRRVENRTRAWDIAQDLASKLEAYYNSMQANANQIPNNPAIKILKNQIKLCAIHSGFWSVWMTVFQSKAWVNDALKNQLLCELFVQSFAGTNYPLPNSECALSPVPLGYNNGLPNNQ